MDPRCDIGGHPITGKYHTYETGETICDKHLLTTPRCARCGIPSRKLIRTGTFSVCRRCLPSIPQCTGCGVPVLQAWFGGSDRSRMFCEKCVHPGEVCDYCGRLAGRYPFRLADGRGACSDCRAEMVRDPVQIERIFRNVRKSVKKLCGLEVRSSLKLVVVSPQEMSRLTQSVFIPTPGFDPRTLAQFRYDGRERMFYVEDSLPRGLLYVVVAHEYAHAWQSETCPPPQGPLLREGFAEWVAHQIAVSLRLADEARRIETREDVYGQGYRLVADLERRLGREDMIAHVKTHL